MSEEPQQRQRTVLESRPRKPSALIPRVWNCGHEMNFGFYEAGYNFCPFCGKRYHKGLLSLIERWLSYATWHMRFRKSSIPYRDMVKKEE